VPVKTSQPDAIAGELKTVFASEREGPMAGMVQFAGGIFSRCGVVIWPSGILCLSPSAKIFLFSTTPNHF